jgi:hypothetical protein
VRKWTHGEAENLDMRTDRANRTGGTSQLGEYHGTLSIGADNRISSDDIGSYSFDNEGTLAFKPNRLCSPISSPACSPPPRGSNR